MTAKEHRALLIRQLIREHQVRSQEELASLLEAEGAGCTQATLSRHLRELSIVRRSGPDGPRYQEDDASQLSAHLAGLVAREILAVDHNGQMVVIRTLPGRAGGVAAWLDQHGHFGILGTIAGDDTLFVAPREGVDSHTLAQHIRDLVAQETP
ncbi:MAG: hypothetical protein JXX28_12105 [Deltaproteobacteria bacterium]|nr:hypothetical protein [Deltaproteobacteria bacterium]